VAPAPEGPPDIPIKRGRTAGFQRPAVEFLSGTAALALLTLVFVWLDLNLATAALGYVIVIVLLSLRGSVVPAIILSIVAIACLNYFFAVPRFSFGIDAPQDTVALAAFATTSFVITTLVRRARRSEDVLSERARLLDLTHDTMFVRDMHDSITYWNRGAEELYGWKGEQAVGKVTHQLLQTRFPQPLQEITALLFRTGRWQGELVHTKRDGTEAIVASRWSLQHDGQGRPVAILETNNDITERKRAEEELRRQEARLRDAQMELAHANRVTATGQLAASIAHEVSQPIAAALTNANAARRWLATEPPDLDEVRQALDRIARDGKRASDIIGRIRALVRKAPPRNDQLDVNEAMFEVIALTRSELRSNGTSLQTELADGLPLIRGDRIQLQQVMLNLILNAVEAMSGSSEAARELLIRTELDGSGGVLIAVQDSGPGLQPESLDRLFDAFYTTKPSGMGMGLSICRSIIESHGGRVWAAPNLPQGAAFHFTLPQRRETAS
jgi:two-component system sensor kinase FixL